MPGKSRFQKKGNTSRQLVMEGLENLRKEGIASTVRKTIRHVRRSRRVNYKKWMRTPLYTPVQLRRQREERFEKKILFSILTPLYNTPEAFLRAMIESVLAQTYQNWELCLADGSDAAHRFVRRICLNWEEAGGLDEAFAVNLNDIDLCLRIREKGYLIVWTPYAELYHYESKSRGGTELPENRILARQENALFRARWGDVIQKGDPYYNPNLTLRRSDFSLKNREEEAL